ncbi:hypothetical protein GF312_13070 [Candidatus Poribacteria bacterium]|nr:hypothetical protein [Candidatus Poribacteria bacterium]
MYGSGSSHATASLRIRVMCYRVMEIYNGKIGQYQRYGNMAQFEKIVPDSDHQNLQYFVSDSSWKDEPILDDVCKTVSERIGDAEHGSIHNIS